MMTEGDPNRDDEPRQSVTFEHFRPLIERAIGKQQTATEGPIKVSAAAEPLASEEEATFE